ncbi:MAG: prephenate dehydratase [Solirubrobacteraceae bacterium MAG38_C4-C5]|nr:prephenate dehydratase [Candidatus Siliceabacter maunaloa]
MPLRVGYLGPRGTFSEQALELGAPDARGVPLATVYDAVMAVQEGRVDRAVVPIENSLEGAVSATLDTLTGPADAVGIVGEAVLPVAHALLARPGVAQDDVRAVTSHPQALAQCAGSLRHRVPDAELVPAASTAEAARRVAASGEPWAAIGPQRAAGIYGLVALAEGIEDEPGNETRFLWLAPQGTEASEPVGRAGAWRTSVAFFGAGDAAPGWLVRCLSELAFRGVNLSRIESRPYRGRLGHYRFFLDMDGRVDDPAVEGAITALHPHCEWVRVLGSYPAAPRG